MLPAVFAGGDAFLFLKAGVKITPVAKTEGIADILDTFRRPGEQKFCLCNPLIGKKFIDA